MNKWWLNSTTVRGALLAGLAVLKQLLDAACLLKFGCLVIQDAEMNTIVDSIVGLVSTIGLVMVITGRWKAALALRWEK